MRSSRAHWVDIFWRFAGVPPSPTEIYLDRKTEKKIEQGNLAVVPPPQQALQREVIGQFEKKLE